MELSIKNVNIVDEQDQLHLTNLFLKNGRIEKIGSCVETKKMIDAKGKVILPGFIDPHVHFRDPGFPHKEDFQTGSMAAAAGGVTTVLDMPNTNPSTFKLHDLEEKRHIAEEKSIVNYGFYLGSDGKNISDLINAKNIAGIKLYLNETTGNLIINNKQIIKNIFSIGRMCCLHAEGETYTSMLEIHNDFDNPLYLCHASSAQEINLIKKAKRQGKKYYLEVCVPHLFLTDVYLKEYQGLGKVKPPLPKKEDQDALWRAIDDGIVDVIATDHAPHTLQEKQSENPPFGLPGVELRLPLLLNEVNQGRLTLAQVQKLISENPARIFGIKNKGKIKEGYDADLVIIDFDREGIIKNQEQVTKCKWSPYHGWKLHGWPVVTFVHGNLVYDQGEINTEHKGKEVVFEHV